MAIQINYPTVYVTHIHQNSRTEHLIFVYKNSTYITLRDKVSGKVYFKYRHTFETKEEAIAFQYGYITSCTQHGNFEHPAKLQTVSLMGYEVKHY